MLGFPKDTKNETKCYVTHGTLGNLEPTQPPMKRKPFAAILSHDFLHRVRGLQSKGNLANSHWKAELILPEELYYILKADFFNGVTVPTYSKVILPLSALLEGEFFTEYIKKGKTFAIHLDIIEYPDVWLL